MFAPFTSWPAAVGVDLEGDGEGAGRRADVHVAPFAVQVSTLAAIAQVMCAVLVTFVDRAHARRPVGGAGRQRVPDDRLARPGRRPHRSPPLEAVIVQVKLSPRIDRAARVVRP